ncbi:hybrid sensor histidine kinase/response regulator transcription factor [Poritiphilus flavus]|uniref:histidine kinase n=1 Tax=Poritiphilus flavus TaxID=2697053 RepID=A0A6L9EH60_9FLAO|nr:ATP-binding protein [Poritiphilus flavus]NAS14041.1 response regulator [Poritiphilus flavus]
MKPYILILVSLFFLCGFAQESGIPYLRNYGPEEFNGHRQNWAVAQDNRGVMYFANGRGLLHFDGEEWGLERMPNDGHIRSLATDNDKIYVGGGDEFGVFSRKGKTYKYKSYIEHLPDSLGAFGRVWTTLVHKDNVFFQTDNFVIRISPDGTSKIWNPDSRIWKLLVVDNELYLNIPDEGLLLINSNDEMVRVPHTELFQSAATEFMLPLNEGWIFEKNNGLMHFSGNEVNPFENQAGSILNDAGINTGLKLRSGDFAIATIKKGCVILSEEGDLRYYLTSDIGLGNDVIRNIYEDSEGSLWFALDSGIARLDLGSPLSFYTQDSGLLGTILDIQKFAGKLYVGTTAGLMVEDGRKFKPFGNIKSIIRDLDTLQGQLIVANSFDELYAIDKSGSLNIIDDSAVNNSEVNHKVLPLREDPRSAVVLFDTGLFHLRWEDNGWKVHQQLESISGQARTLVQLRPGVIWITTNINGLYRLKYSISAEGIIDLENAIVDNYNLEDGVPSGYNRTFSIHDELFFKSQKDSVFLYDPKTDGFSKVTDFTPYVGFNEKGMFPEESEINGRAWFRQQDSLETHLIEVQAGKDGYSHRSYALSKAVQNYKDPFSTLTFHASGKMAYLGGSKGIVAYDLNKANTIVRNLNVMITEVVTSDTIYNEINASTVLNALPFNNARLKFEYAAPNYKDAEFKLYQYRLEGFDKAWSPPSPEHTKEYTGLPPGEYTFKVKALNDYFVESPVAALSIKVRQPWYWNAYSISIYLVCLVLLIYAFSHWRSRQLRQRNIMLKGKIAEAVKETRRQAEEIQNLYDVKNKFFANISHELRTPLTLILGPSNDLLEDASTKPEQRNRLTFINNNAKRLLRLINQLLDLSKLEAGKLDLQVSQQNLADLVCTLTKSFDSLAVSRNIRLSYQSDTDDLFVFYDTDKLEKVLVNLLSNALKFTGAGGKVEVRLTRGEEQAVLFVQDTGIGIHPDQLPYIFDRFYQADHSESREYEGTGIGLSLAKELVELHGGTIEVESKAGKGTLFTVKLPLGKAHYEEHQLAAFKAVKVPEKQSVVGGLIEDSETIASEHEEVVLIVEDNKEMRFYIKSLMQADYRILEAENGLEGFELAREQVPDLIISDVMMPRMNGTEMCKEIKKNEITAHIPVILLTAKASEEDKIKGLNIEADDYLAKPFNKAELAARVKNLILIRRKLQKRFAETALITPKEIAVTSMEEAFLQKLVNLIEEKMGDETFGVEDLASAMSLSRSQLHRKMLSITNQAPSLFIRKYRLERAKQLLEKGVGRVSDIAYEVGFSSPSYFTKCFTEAFGYSPREVNKSS